MLISIIRVLVNNLVKKRFYKKKINILIIYFYKDNINFLKKNRLLVNT